MNMNFYVKNLLEIWKKQKTNVVHEYEQKIKVKFN